MRPLTPKEITALSFSAANPNELTTVTVPGNPYPPVPVPTSPSPPLPTGGGGGSPSPPPPPNLPPCVANAPSGVQWTAIGTFEGGIKNTAYVPTSGSGATIGGGVDLSRQYESTAIAWGMPSAQAQEAANVGLFATGYGQYGKTGLNATAALNSIGGMTVSSTVANAMTQNATAHAASLASSGFASTTGTSVNEFNNLSVPIQNALTEAVYNAGSWPAALSANPGLQSAVSSFNWSLVASTLQANSHWSVKNAGNALQNAISQGSVPPSGGTCYA